MKSNDKGESDISPTESETTRMVGSIPRGNWEIPETSLSLEMDRSEKARCHNVDMYVSGRSDSPIVSEKQANKAGPPTAAESVEERGLAKENASQPLLVRTQSRVARSRGLLSVREAARGDKKAKFNNLLSHVTLELLQASFFDLKLKDKLKRMVHWDLAEVGSWLSSVYKGWCNYHAVPLNSTRLCQFRTAIQQIWMRVLRRRSQRAHRMTWAKFGKLCRRWLPTPKILHPYPSERFARLHPR